MAIPDFQTLMLPLLQHMNNGEEHTNSEVLDTLADRFNLSEEEKKQLLPSGQDFIFRNRVAWARTHLKAAGLIDNPKRGVFVITQEGRDLLAKAPTAVNLQLLREYDSYRAFRGRHKPKKTSIEEFDNADEDKTPEERIEEAYEIMRESLIAQILDQLKASSPSFFENVVVEVLVSMGYGGSRRDAGQAIGRSGDEGIDGIIKEDRLGLDIIYIQAKKWENSVSRPEIQKFAGALQGKRARKGVFITTSDFSSSAYEFAKSIESKIILIDGQLLAQYMIDFGIGVTTEATYELKRLDSDYFSEE